MKLSEFINATRALAADTDPELVLYDRFGGRNLRNLPDEDRFDFEIMRGENEVVLEFD